MGTLTPNAVDELTVYRIERIDNHPDALMPVRDNPQLLVRNTEAEDDFIVRWNEPLALKINETPHLLVGLSLPTLRETGGWINRFIREGSPHFTYQQTVESPLSMAFFDTTQPPNDGSLKLHVDENLTIPVGVIQTETPGSEISAEKATNGESVVKQEEDTPHPATPTKTGTGVDGEPTLAIVPCNLLALIHQYRLGLVQFDASGNRFIENPATLDYTKARLYTQTIDDVPAAVELLASRNFAVLSESSRIAEIQQQAGSLQTLVVVVAVGVFLFGVITVFSVFVDSTDRKKGTIGILRVMGMSRIGVFWMVLIRALTIGMLAAILCSAVGYGLAMFLGADLSSSRLFFWKPIISVILQPDDLLLVAIGALLCACLGAIMPAIKASGLDPFDAIMEGQFA